MQVSKDKVVGIDYTLTDDQGQVLDSSKGQDPLFYIQGAGNIVPGLEKALEGKSKGDSFKVSLPPEEGYGPNDPELVLVVPRKRFPGSGKLEVGMQFEAETDSGVQQFTIVGLEGDDVKVDGNHPLAGATLNFDVEVVEVRDATREELSHGHVHGPGGHHH